MNTVKQKNEFKSLPINFDKCAEWAIESYFHNLIISKQAITNLKGLMDIIYKDKTGEFASYLFEKYSEVSDAQRFYKISLEGDIYNCLMNLNNKLLMIRS
jgi:hypothetical protein